MEQAYGFTPTHTEQYISPTTHKYKKYNFQAQASTWTKDTGRGNALYFLTVLCEFVCFFSNV